MTPRTLEFYDLRIGEFFAWLRRQAPEVARIAEVDVNHLRGFRHGAAPPLDDGDADELARTRRLRRRSARLREVA